MFIFGSAEIHVQVANLKGFSYEAPRPRDTAQELRGLKAELESESSTAVAIPESPPASPRPEEKKLEAAITIYEKAAGGR